MHRPMASKSRKRKKVRCRRFLVSLAVRRRKSPISHLLGTKEIRHDAQMLGDSGVFLPFVRSAPPSERSDESSNQPYGGAGQCRNRSGTREPLRRGIGAVV